MGAGCVGGISSGLGQTYVNVHGAKDDQCENSCGDTVNKQIHVCHVYSLISLCFCPLSWEVDDERIELSVIIFGVRLRLGSHSHCPLPMISKFAS